jgi:ATP-dependent DNA ligase
MLKEPGAGYHFGRAQNWWKAKDFYEGDFEITGAYEGDEPSTIGTLGGVYIKGELTWRSQNWPIDCKCGGGFKSTNRNPFSRDNLWAMHGAGLLVGRVCEVKFQEVTKNEDGRFALRFPTFLRLRDDK